MHSKQRWLDPIFGLVGIVLVFLVGLGIVQYRWLDRMAASDLERMRSNMYAGLFLMSADVDRTVATVYETFDLTAIRPEAWADELSLRWADWKKRAPHSKLVSGVELVNEWPGTLHPVSTQRTARPMPFPDEGRFSGQLLCPEGTPQTPPQIFIPLRALGRLDDSPSAWVKVTLSAAELLNEIVPQRIDYFFGQEAMSPDFRLAVVDRHDDTRVLYTYPETQTGRPLPRTDAQFLMLSLRMRDSLSLDHAVRQARAKAEGDEATRFAQRPGCWRIDAVHQDGSLKAAATNRRYQQMATSFGILALLGLASIALVAAARRATRLGQQQMAFVATVTHELRTPLAVLRAAGDNLAESVIEERDRVTEYGRLIRAESRRLSDMVENVLRFAQVRASPDKSTWRPVDLEARVNAAVDAVKPGAKRKRTTIEVDWDAPPPIVGDGAAIGAAIENLISNAVKYGPEAQTVTVRVEAGVRRGRIMGAIRVVDQGDGIPTSERRRLFEPFFRGGDARKRGIQGAGLGLALVYRIAKMHGGTVEVDSGPGCTFTLWLLAEEATDE